MEGLVLFVGSWALFLAFAGVHSLAKHAETKEESVLYWVFAIGAFLFLWSQFN